MGVNLQDLLSYSSTYLLDNSQENREELLTQLSLGGSLRKAVVRLLDSPSDLSEVASRSYEHNNGFCKVLLIDQRPRYSIRLHLWPKEALEDSHIHNHPWDMSGVLISGKYEWEVVSVIQSKESTEELIYECKYLQDYSGHTFNRIGYAEVKRIHSTTLRQNEKFNFPSTASHRISKMNSSAADSVIVTGVSKGFNPRVITSNRLNDTSTQLNRPLLSDQLSQKLADFLDRTENAS